MRTGFSILLAAAALLTGCGSSGLSSAQSNRGVQQSELQVEHQVSKCLPTAGGAPDPLLLTRSSVRAKFRQCTGVSAHGKAFDVCAFKVVLSGLPTVARLERGLTACVQKNA